MYRAFALALWSEGRPALTMHETIGDDLGKLRAVVHRNQIKHHVQRGGSSSACPAIFVDHKYLVQNFYLGEKVLKGGASLPVQGHLVSLQDARSGQCESAGIDGAQSSAKCGPTR